MSGSDDGSPAVSGAASTALERCLGAAASVGLTSQRIADALETVGLEDVVAERAPTGAVQAASEQVDFEHSRAYARDRIELGVRVNLADREPAGVVDPDDYEDVRQDLIDGLSDVTTPDGNPVFERVARRETVFSGPYVENAPDVITVPAGFDEFLSTTVGDGQFAPPSEPYNHKREGVVALAGEGVETGASASLDGAHLFDVAPTVLATLDLPASDRMDGEVLGPVSAAGEASYPDYDAEWEVSTDDEAVEARLADLGYLE